MQNILGHYNQTEVINLTEVPKFKGGKKKISRRITFLSVKSTCAIPKLNVKSELSDFLGIMWKVHDSLLIAER